MNLKQSFENKIFDYLSELDKKLIFRVDYEKILEDKLNLAQNYFNENLYIESEYIINELLKYQKKYEFLFLLALIKLKINDLESLEEILYEIVDTFGINEELKINFSSFFE